MSRVTLRERFFPLHQPDDVDQFVEGFSWSAIFKAGTGDKTIEAWLVAQKALEPRVDVAVGFVRLPADRPASDRVAARADVPHRSPQLLLFGNGRLRFHLDEFEIVPDRLVPLLDQHLPAGVGPAVRNRVMVSLEPYRRLVADFVNGAIPDERFQWSYLERLEQEAAWRDDETFALLNSLFENEWGRNLRAARLVAVEFQGQLACRLEPLKTRAVRLLERLSKREDEDDRLL